MFEDLSRELVISRGIQNNSNKRNNNSQVNHNPPVSPGKFPTHTNMERVDNALILPVFKGIESEDP
jgi:hypothetical protein